MERSFRPKYNLGKITNKYQIVDILGHVMYQYDLAVFMHGSNSTFRNLLIDLLTTLEYCWSKKYLIFNNLKS
jgi:hypothetical protein